MSSPTPEFRPAHRGFTPAAPVRPEADIARVRSAMEQWRRRSRLIRFLRSKGPLPVAIALVSLSLVGWIGLKSLLADPASTSPPTGPRCA